MKDGTEETLFVVVTDNVSVSEVAEGQSYGLGSCACGHCRVGAPEQLQPRQ